MYSINASIFAGKKHYMGLFSFLTKKGDRIQDFVSRGAVVIDVRSKQEFQAGHIKGSKNMPLPGIAGKLKELKKLEKPIIFCCASGMRSGQATAMMKREGLDCLNGGGWQSLSRHL